MALSGKRADRNAQARVQVLNDFNPIVMQLCDVKSMVYHEWLPFQDNGLSPTVTTQTLSFLIIC